MTSTKQHGLVLLATQLKYALNNYQAIYRRLDKQQKAPINWYLVVGTPHSGKTSLLQSNTLTWLETPIHDPNIDQDLEKLENQCVHFAKEGVYIEVDAELISQSTNTNTSEMLSVLSLADKIKLKKLINGIMLCIDSMHLISKNNHNYLIESLRHTIDGLAPIISRDCQCQLILTKCDQLKGFSETFSLGSQAGNVGSLELSLNSPLLQDKLLFHKQFDLRFKQMLVQLNRTIIERMQSEQSELARVLINEFPLQIESYKSALRTLVDDVLAIWHRTLACVVFTSAEQTTPHQDRLRQPLAKVFDVVALPSTTPFSQAQSIATGYALTNIDTQNSPPAKTSLTPTKAKTALRTSAIVLASCSVLAAGVLWLHNIKQNVTSLNQAETAIIHFNDQLQFWSKSKLSLEQSFKLLDKLKQSVDVIESSPNVKFKASGLSINKSRNLKQFAQDIYIATLEKTLGPLVKSILTEELTQALTGEPRGLYQGLKLYLMLGSKQAMNQHNFMLWFNQSLTQITNLTTTQKTKLFEYVNTLVTHYPAHGLALDTALITHARAKLNSLPKPLLSFLILKDSMPGQVIDPLHLLDAKSKILTYAKDQPALPGIYSVDNYRLVYKTLIPVAVKEAVNGNAVIGLTHESATNIDQEEQQLTVQVRSLYKLYYQQWWNNIVDSLRLIPAKNMRELSTVVSQLSSPSTSPLQHVITLVSNRHAPGVMRENNRFRHLQALLAQQNDQDGPLAELYSSLSELNTLLTSWQIGDSSQLSALGFARSKAQNDTPDNPINNLELLGKSLPKPLNVWVKQLAHNSWKLILAKASSQIDQKWQTEIAPYYQHYFAGHFPFARKASEEASLPHFVDFFKPGGKFDNFFKNNIAPFIDTKPAKWKTISFNGAKVPFSQTAIKCFEQINILQAMFFDKHTHKLGIAMTLTPESVEQNLRKVTFHYGDKSFSDGRNTMRSHELFWPNTLKPNASIDFKDNLGETSTLAEHGSWALFKLLWQHKPETSVNPQYYRVTFDNNGLAAKYVVKLDRTINPFIPGIISHFQCPNSLLKKNTAA